MNLVKLVLFYKISNILKLPFYKHHIPMQKSDDNCYFMMPESIPIIKYSDSTKLK